MCTLYSGCVCTMDVLVPQVFFLWICVLVMYAYTDGVCVLWVCV